MIGDVNLFLNDPDNNQCGEIEIMIAETMERRKGCGIETLCTFMRYGIENVALFLLKILFIYVAIEILHITRFVVKIGLKNTPSIALFTQKFQFVEVKRIFSGIFIR